MAFPQKWFLPLRWCLHRKWLSPEKLKIFVGSRILLLCSVYHISVWHVVSCSRVSKQQARSTHISVTVYLSQVSSPSLWWGDILGIRWNLARSKISVACRLLQATPTPQGERGCSCNLFPSRPKWSLGQQALQIGRPKLGLGGGRGMRGFRPDENAICPGQSNYQIAGKTRQTVIVINIVW